MKYSLIYPAVYNWRKLSLAFIRRNYLNNFRRGEILGPCCYTTTRAYCQNTVMKESYMGENTDFQKKEIILSENLTIRGFAKKIGVESSTMMKLLSSLDYELTDGERTELSMYIAEIIADECGYTVTNYKEMNKQYILSGRRPIVTIMGHVDHGKTTLLDHLRNSSVALNEAGGITQRIGAFSVKIPGLDDLVTFVDTPGHAAFNAMRARGAQLTDIVVLVIAAEDGIMAQTLECLRHIREANVPFIVAINKIDLPHADPEKVKIDLLNNDVVLDEYGGDVKYVEISALKGTNINHLLLLLNNFAKEHKFEATLDGPVEAVVLETQKTQKTGKSASIIIKSGRLTKGKILLAGESKARVRRMKNENGEFVTAAYPSDPVEIIGWRSMPSPGEKVIEMSSDSEVRQALRRIRAEARGPKVVQPPPKKNPNKKPIDPALKGGQNRRKPFRELLREQAALGLHIKPKIKEDLNILIKADLTGSLEAILGIIKKFESEYVRMSILRAVVGVPSKYDVELVKDFKGHLYCFDTQIPNDVLQTAEEMGVPIKHFDIIYEMLDDVRDEIENLLPPEKVDTILGEGQVLNQFPFKRGIRAATCHVSNGAFDCSNENMLWQVVRDGNVIHEGKSSFLRKGGDDILVVNKESECSLVLKGFNEFYDEDKIICLERKIIKRTYEWEM